MCWKHAFQPLSLALILNTNLLRKDDQTLTVSGLEVYLLMKIGVVIREGMYRYEDRGVLFQGTPTIMYFSQKTSKEE